ncbi:MAG: mechanosensitive ion channel protein MscS [Nitrospirales bacterium]|nr:MAG: mechanosensitive ion channel protein MscS [Nitrospirales bacterium]
MRSTPYLPLIICIFGFLTFPSGLTWSQEPLDIKEATPEPSTQEPTQEIAVGSEKIEDELIKKRLVDVYQHVPALANIAIEVQAGVVQLAGETLSKDAHQKALELARRTEGVVSVTDNITQQRDIGNRLSVVQEKLFIQLNDLVSMIPLLIIALTVFLLFWFLASFISKWSTIYRKFTPNIFLQSLLRQTIRGAILFLGFIVMLEILDATALLGTIVGVAGVMGLAVGFALRDTVENYIASILLSLRQPFRPLDHVVLEDYEGLIMKLTSRETILMTLDGNHVRIPNATVYKGILLNYSRNPKRRFTFEVGIDTAVNIEAARQLAIKTLRHTPGVIPDPPVRCFVEKLGDSNVVLKMLAWTTQDQFDFLKVKSEGIRNVKEAFDLENYEMPEPIYRLKVQGLSQENVQAVSDQKPTPKTYKDSAPSQTDPSRAIADVSKDHHIVEQISTDKEQTEDSEVDLLAQEK